MDIPASLREKLFQTKADIDQAMAGLLELERNIQWIRERLQDASNDLRVLEENRKKTDVSRKKVLCCHCGKELKGLPYDSLNYCLVNDCHEPD